MLTTLSKDTFDVKALRAFRVLRPLRLVSGVPSKWISNNLEVSPTIRGNGLNFDKRIDNHNKHRDKHRIYTYNYPNSLIPVFYKRICHLELEHLIVGRLL